MMNSTMISYTPTEELPMPPQWMLDELELEVTKYNTFLMSQILTIREARPIRLALREKLQVHPIAKILKEEANRVMSFHSVTYYANHFSEIVMNRRNLKDRGFSKELTNKVSKYSGNFWPVSKEVMELPECYLDQMKVKSGKNKGKYNHKLTSLASNIICDFKNTVSKFNGYRADDLLISGHRWSKVIDRYFEKGFFKFFEENFEYNKKLTKFNWDIRVNH